MNNSKWKMFITGMINNKFVITQFKVLFIWSPIISLLFTVGFSGTGDMWPRFLISLIISTTVAMFCIYGSKGVSLLEDYLMYKLKRTVPEHGHLWGVLISYLFMVPGLFFGFKFAAIFSRSQGSAWSGPSFEDYSAGLVFGLMVSGLFLLSEVMREAKQAKKEAELKFQKLENERLKAQVSALSAQMNPHLLFNSLNTIAATIFQNPQSAEDMVVQLSELYRGVLKAAREESHSLLREIELCESYLKIEKSRFGNRIHYTFDIDPLVDLERINIPVLLLQPIVENSIKHGIASKRDGGKLKVSIHPTENNLNISIQDNGLGSASETLGGAGTGINNCRSRMHIKYGDSAEFSFTQSIQGSTTNMILPLSEVLNA
ncbi:MAG: histidine kinase [Bdellovibrionaceae bacterium]|jgi:sensor histidine kinase YesM|nr:histidine kinase [Pseudobdellovibrionaceae bacterium]